MEQKEKLDYFEVPAVSASFMKKVETHIRTGLPLSHKDEKNPYSLFRGSQVHRAIETEGASLTDEIWYFDHSPYVDKLNQYEKTIAQKAIGGMDIGEAYLNTYNNKEVRKARQEYEKGNIDIKGALEMAKLTVNENLKEYVDTYVHTSLDHKGMLCLNELDFVTDPVDLFQEISNMSNAILSSPAHEMLMTNATDIEREREHYLEYKGLPVKLKTDLTFTAFSGAKIGVDYKSSSFGRGYSNMISFNTLRQASFYTEMLGLDTFYVLNVENDSFRTVLYQFTPDVLEKARYGGYLKPMGTMYEQVTFPNRDIEWLVAPKPFLSDNQIKYLEDNGFWPDGPNKEAHYMGWEEIFDYIKKHDLLDKLD